MKKIFSALLALTFLLTALASCGAKSVTDGVYSTEEELRVVGTIGEYEVLYDEYRYVAVSCREMMENKYGKGIWDDETTAKQYEDELREMVMARITANYAVLSLCAQHGYKNSLTDKETVKKVNSTVDLLLYEHAMQNNIEVTVSESSSGELKYKYEKGGLDKAYEHLRRELYDYNLTERVLRLTLGVEYAFEVLINLLTAKENVVIYKDQDIEDFMFSDQFICTRHIFIENDKDDDVEANRALANEALEKYRNGEMSMDQLIGSIYNEDVTTVYEGNYFTHGEMEKVYEDAAFALKEGEVSDVIEGENGFYIIERKAKSNVYMLSNFETFATQITYAIVNSMVRSHQAELSLELNEFGRSLVLYTIPATRTEEETK